MKSKAIRFLSLILALTMLASFAACGDDTVAEEATSAIETTVENETSATEVTDAVDATEAVSDAADTTEAPTEAETDATTEAAAPAEAPTEAADILKLYNDATGKVASQKVAFSKNRETVSHKYDAGVALKAFKGLVFQFMGIGEENVYNKDIAKNADDYSKHFLASKLSTGDITAAKCTVDDKGNYVVNISVKGGSSSVIEGKEQGNYPSACIDKSGLSAGRDDKDYYDHKTAQNVYDAIDDVASGATIKESYSNANVKAVIDAEGNLQSLTFTFDIAFDISKVYGSSGVATGTTTVKYTFKW